MIQYDKKRYLLIAGTISVVTVLFVIYSMVDSKSKYEYRIISYSNELGGVLDYVEIARAKGREKVVVDSIPLRNQVDSGVYMRNGTVYIADYMSMVTTPPMYGVSIRQFAIEEDTVRYINEMVAGYFFRKQKAIVRFEGKGAYVQDDSLLYKVDLEKMQVYDTIEVSKAAKE